MFERKLTVRVFSNDECTKVQNVLDETLNKGKRIYVDHNPKYGMFTISAYCGIIEYLRVMKQMKRTFNNIIEC